MPSDQSPSQAFGSLRADPRAHNLLVGENVSIDPTARIGANVILHDGVVIGAESLIKHNCIIGQQPSLGKRSNASPQSETTTHVGAGATICNGCVILRGVQIGDGTIIGDQAFLREGATIGRECVIGHGSAVGVACQIADNVTVQGPAYLAPEMTIESEVTVAGLVVVLSDTTMGRDPAAAKRRVTLRRGCRVGAGACFFPDIEVGEEALIGAGALVLESVPARTVVVGSPARALRQVEQAEMLDH